MTKTYHSIIASHQARIRCFLHDYIIQYAKESGDINIVSNLKNSPNIHRFQNGSIIKLEINKDEIKINLLFNGEIDERKPTYIYYVKPNTIDINAEKKQYQIQEFPEIILKNYNISSGKNINYVFYLIRHGQAEHNILSGVKKLTSAKNTDLTSIGKEQALTSGQMLLENIGSQSINFIFASDLSRTHQTMGLIISKIKTNILNNKIIILPCSHELSYTKKSNCDYGTSYFNTPNENISTCNLDKQFINNCNNIYNIPIDWDYYVSYYNGTRKNSKNKKNCSDINMIELSIEYINNIISNEIKYLISTVLNTTSPIKMIDTKNDIDINTNNVNDNDIDNGIDIDIDTNNDNDINLYKKKDNIANIVKSVLHILNNKNDNHNTDNTLNIDNFQTYKMLKSNEIDPLKLSSILLSVLNDTNNNLPDKSLSEILSNSNDKISKMFSNANNKLSHMFDYFNSDNISDNDSDNSYKWKTCKEHQKFETPKTIIDIKNKCQTKINNKIDKENWNIISILNERECMIYNKVTKEHELIDLKNNIDSNNTIPDTVVESIKLYRKMNEDRLIN